MVAQFHNIGNDIIDIRTRTLITSSVKLSHPSYGRATRVST